MATKKVVKKAAKAARSASPAKVAAPKAVVKARSSRPSKAGRWTLRLYIAGDSPRSRTALENLRKLCEAQLKDNYDIEVIDLTKRPDLAKADQILAVPTLIRTIPEPMKRVIGDLSNSDRAVIALDLQRVVSES